MIYNRKLPEKRFLNHLNQKNYKKKYNHYRNCPQNSMNIENVKEAEIEDKIQLYKKVLSNNLILHYISYIRFK